MGFQTYDDASRREDLLSILKDVSPNSDNYFSTNLGTSTATNTLHEWLVRSVARPTSTNFKAEGFDATDPSLDAPTRSNNVTAVMAQIVKVSGTEDAVSRGLPGSAFDDEKMVKLGRLKADLEYAIVNGAKASGASGVARGMAGFDAVISTNMTARNSGTSMSIQELEDILTESWSAVGSEFVADIVAVPMGIKRAIAAFTSRNQGYTMEKDEIYQNVGIFASNAGTVKIIPHKDIRNVAGSVTVYALREDLYKVAFLREPQYEELSKTGDSKRGMYVTEATLESLGQAASVKRTGYNING